MGTLEGSLAKRSVRVPTVEMQSLLGQTRKNSPIVFLKNTELETAKNTLRSYQSVLLQKP